MPSNKKNCPIGVFDSGLGGLTVVKELMRELPAEDIVYFGDTARVPYGTKSKESIIRFSKENAGVLLKHKVKMIVVACNSSSSYALSNLKKTFKLPIIGVIKPGAQKAILATKNKKVGVIATTATIHSQSYTKRINQLGRGVKVFVQSCPLFVPLAEEGWFHNGVTLTVAKAYLDKLKKANVDTLILGCTHYPLLKTTIKKVMGPKVSLIDSAKEVAREVKGLLKEQDMKRETKRKGQCTFLISDEPKHFRQLAKRFLGYDVKNVTRI